MAGPAIWLDHYSVSQYKRANPNWTILTMMNVKYTNCAAEPLFKICFNQLLFCVILLAVITLFAACRGPATNQSGLTLAGSTSVQPFAEKLAEHYMKTAPDAIINVQGGGSSAGIQAVRSGAAQAGMSSRELADEEKDLRPITIALDAIAVIVHPHNPIVNLDLKDLRAIYSGQITNWKVLGGDDHRIHCFTREEGSGTREAFEKKVMEHDPISLENLVQDSNGAVLELVAQDSHSIGYISFGIVNTRVKAVAIDNIAPTEENFVGKRYKLIRPFLFVFREEPAGLAKSFVDYVLGEEGQHLLKLEGLIPVKALKVYK